MAIYRENEMTPTQRAAAQQALEWFDRNTYGDEAVDVYEALRTALAEQPAEQQEPADRGNHVHSLLAWIIDECVVYPESPDEKAFAKRLLDAITHPKSGYTAPQPAKREPLTDEQISLMAHNDDEGDWNHLTYRDCWHEGYKAGARAIERAHGIGGQS